MSLLSSNTFSSDDVHCKIISTVSGILFHENGSSCTVYFSLTITSNIQLSPISEPISISIYSLMGSMG